MDLGFFTFAPGEKALGIHQDDTPRSPRLCISSADGQKRLLTSPQCGNRPIHAYSTASLRAGLGNSLIYAGVKLIHK